MRRGMFNPQYKVIQSRARDLRKGQAPAEQKLWGRLRGKRLDGYTFRRQHPACGYIVDFYCPQCRLVIELDGDSHSEREQYDENRTRELERNGLRVVRYTNIDIFENFDAVLEDILERCVNCSNPSPLPSPLSGERGEKWRPL